MNGKSVEENEAIQEEKMLVKDGHGPLLCAAGTPPRWHHEYSNTFDHESTIEIIVFIIRYLVQ